MYTRDVSEKALIKVFLIEDVGQEDESKTRGGGEGNMLSSKDRKMIGVKRDN